MIRFNLSVMRQKNKSETCLVFLQKNLGEAKGIDCLAQAFGKRSKECMQTHIRRQIFIIKQMTASL